jgi:hypothetical protein
MARVVAIAAPEHCLYRASLAGNSIEVIGACSMDEDQKIVQGGGQTMFPSCTCQIGGCWPLSDDTTVYIIFLRVCFNNNTHHPSSACP